MKTIESAAIKILDGDTNPVYTGDSHAAIVGVIYLPSYHDTDESHAATIRAEREEGFVTNDGEFVDREDAYIIARAADQLIEETPGGRLFSYNLRRVKKK